MKVRYETTTHRNDNRQLVAHKVYHSEVGPDWDGSNMQTYTLGGEEILTTHVDQPYTKTKALRK